MIPTSVPSAVPTCLAEELLGKSYFVPSFLPRVGKVCLKIEFFFGGIFSYDDTNSTCQDDPFIDSGIISVFDSTSGNTVTFDRVVNNQLDGVFMIEEDPSLPDLAIVVLHILIFPSCISP